MAIIATPSLYSGEKCFLFELATEQDQTAIDYLTFNCNTIQDGEIAWEIWNDWMDCNPDLRNTMTPKRTAKGFVLTCENMGIMWTRTGASTLWGASEAGSMLANHRLTPLLLSSRVDIQVSGRLSERDPQLAKRLYDHFGEEAGKKAARMRRTYMESDTGSTVYLGSRSSPRFLRVYDKGAQAGTMPLGLYWRVELELKRSMATDTWEAYVESGRDPAFLLSQVANYLATVNVFAPLWDPATAASIPLRPRKQTAESMLGWLNDTVLPVVVKLNRMGKTEEVLSTLRLNQKGE